MKCNIGKIYFAVLYYKLLITIQCPPLNWITLGRIKSDNINRMIQLTEVTFCYKASKNSELFAKKANKIVYSSMFSHL